MPRKNRFHSYSRPRRLPGHKGWYLRVYDKKTRKRGWIYGGPTQAVAEEARDNLMLGILREPRWIDLEPAEPPEDAVPAPKPPGPPVQDTPDEESAIPDEGFGSNLEDLLPWDDQEGDPLANTPGRGNE